MSGFLRRLAAQAMGLADPVRTAASSPYGGPPALAEEFLPMSGDNAPVVSADGAPVGKRVDFTAPVSARVEVPAGQRRADGTTHPDPAIHLTTAPLAGSSQGKVSSAGMKVTEQEISYVSNAPVIGPSPLLPVDRDAAALPEIAPERRPYVGDAKVQEPATGITPFADYQSTEVGPTELLLPVQARPRPARGLFERERPVSGLRTPGSRPAAVEEATEVHVNIGRIEVTAVHEAPPAKRAAPNRPAPMSLHDYLAKRQGGRS
jgi:hypothetical protein